jgi:hypothetical protein
MNSSEAQPSAYKIEHNAQQDFSSYQQEYMATLEKAAEALRNAISLAQQSINERLKETESEQPELPASLPGDLSNQLQPITTQVVNEAFARAKAVWEKAEHATIEAPVGAYTPQVTLPATGPPATETPADLFIATEGLVSQATKSLNSAMDNILKTMRRDLDCPPGG